MEQDIMSIGDAHIAIFVFTSNNISLANINKDRAAIKAFSEAGLAPYDIANKMGYKVQGSGRCSGRGQPHGLPHLHRRDGYQYPQGQGKDQ